MCAAALTLTGRSLLAIFAHPDDESLACGGLLARCAALGARVSLLCLTRGESGPSASALHAAPAAQAAGVAPEHTSGIARAGHAGTLAEHVGYEAPGAPPEARQGAPVTTPDSLAAIRTRELEAAARVLGIAEVVVLDHEDGMLPWADADALDASIRAAIDRFRPGVVITFGEDGLYWHPDHVAVHERVTAVIAALGSNAPALYYVTMPPGRMRAVLDAATAGRLPSTAPRGILGIADADAFGSLAAAPTLVIEAGELTVRKLAALRCHRSQLEGDALDVLSKDDAVRLLGTEHFRRAGVGGRGEPFIECLAAPESTPGCDARLDR